MWESFKARLEENETDRPLPLRRAFFDILRGSGLRPGGGITKKMVSFEFGAGESLLWEIQQPANLFLDAKFRDRVEKHGFTSEVRPYDSRIKDGGRHSALSRDWAFGENDCIVVRIDNPDALRRLLGVLLHSDDALVLNPAAITRWIERLRHFFPSLDRFDRPDPDFDEAERNYKLATISKLRPALENAGDDSSIARAVFEAATDSNNLLDWRTSEPLSVKSNADHGLLNTAIASLVHAALGSPEGHAEALDAFARVWKEAVPKGTEDAARQIGEFIFFHHGQIRRSTSAILSGRMYGVKQ